MLSRWMKGAHSQGLKRLTRVDHERACALDRLCLDIIQEMRHSEWQRHYGWSCLSCKRRSTQPGAERGSESNPDMHAWLAGRGAAEAGLTGLQTKRACLHLCVSHHRHSTAMFDLQAHRFVDDQSKSPFYSISIGPTATSTSRSRSIYAPNPNQATEIPIAEWCGALPQAAAGSRLLSSLDPDRPRPLQGMRPVPLGPGRRPSIDNGSASTD